MAPLPSIWILDDSTLEADAVARALSDTYTTTTFIDASPMLERIAEGTVPDLLVLDWFLPGVSGDEVCSYLRTNPTTIGLPVLVLTGGRAELSDALSAGADDYIAKPFGMEELHARAGALLRSSRLRTRAENAEKALSTLLEREQVARLAAENANRQKDEFLATLSHELRTPLHAILGWVTLLREGGLESQMRDRALGTIERNARLQAQLVEDLLDVSRIISGKLDIERVTVEIGSCVAAAIESARPSAEAKSIALASPPDTHPHFVLGDQRRLQQVIWNLLTNAVKFTPKDGRIEVSIAADASGVRITVRDDGTGIDPTFLPHVFERFSQADGATTRSHTGLGLGLAIVRHIVESHGGGVIAESEGKGRGATVTVTLPVHDPLRARLPVVQPMAGLTADLLRGVHVLAVDDQKDARELVAAILEQCGATVSLAGSVVEALEVLAVRRPDVIVSDISMPGHSGMDLMRRVRATPGPTASIPAVALTALARTQERNDALHAGFQSHLAKPFTPSELVRVVEGLLGIRPPSSVL